jgi:hypothetical protein
MPGGGVSLACWAEATPKAADNIKAEASDSFAREFIVFHLHWVIDAHKTKKRVVSVAGFQICNGDG